MSGAIFFNMSDNEQQRPVPTAEELKERIRDLQIRERDHNIALRKFE